MADPIVPAAPQAFAFGSLRDLKGSLVSFNGENRRRGARHRYSGRSGGNVEDMGAENRTLTVRLVFTGDACAKEYADFLSYVRSTPSQLLVHPIAGRWQAFCEGPSTSADFSRATDEIQVNVTFVEDELDATGDAETLDVATAAQNASGQVSAFETAMAQYLGVLAKANTLRTQIIAAIDSALGALDDATSPIESMRDAIAGSFGLAASVVGKATAISTKALLVKQDAESFVDAAADLYDGENVSAAVADSLATLLGVIASRTLELEELLVDSVPSTAPSLSADAVSEAELLLDACYSLDEAVKAARPPTKHEVVPRVMSLVEFCIMLYGAELSLARASDILSLNRIPNPAAIPAGTRLRVPSR